MHLSNHIQTDVVDQEMIPETINSDAYQPFVKVERLSETIYQGCITNGYVKVNENKSNLNRNTPPFVIDAGVMTKIKEVVFQNCTKFKDQNVKIVVIPQKLFQNKLQNNSGSRNSLPESFTKQVNNPGLNMHTSLNKPTKLYKPGTKMIFPPSKIVRYGVEDLKRDELKRKEEIKKKIWKQKMLRKMLDKYHEKETKKEVLYRQKILTKFVLKHKEVVHPYTEFLICARKHVKGRKDGKIILKELENIKDAKVRKYVKIFYKNLLYAIEEVPVNKKKLPREQHGEPEIDLFANAALITSDQQLLECICGKPNCLGIHPEKFY